MPYELGSLTVYYFGEEGSGFEDQVGGGAQEFEAIREGCLADGILFEDAEFPADYSSVYHDHIPKEIQWMRPSELVEDPHFFADGAGRFDVNQGEVGNCWFIASVASLTMDEKVFYQVVPEDNSFAEGNYCGAFHFRFWQFGRWVDVTIDDRLPTQYGQLIFMHSADQHEFWSALLEKAYAKLHGCYETLTSGLNIEALEDFTGGLAEKYRFQDEEDAPSHLFQIMLKSYERGSLMGCSLQGTGSGESEGPYGLICGHAYTITSVKQFEINGNAVSLVRVRNPWGNQAEWTGRWSDNSEEWQEVDEDTKDALELRNKDDGEFWISYEDFVHYFSLLEICHLGPHGMLSEDSSKKKWEMEVFEDSWVRGATAGGCTNFMQSFPYNPQFNIEITDPDPDDDEDQCTVIIALMQKFRRAKRSRNEAIGFYLYRIDVDEAINVSKPLRGDFFRYNRSAAKVNAFENSRELCCRFRLHPGIYTIIPSCFEPNVEGEFLLRVYSETKTTMEINDIEQPIDVSEEMKIWAESELPEEIVQAFQDKSEDSETIQLIDFRKILNENLQVDFEFGGFDESLCRLLVVTTDGEEGITLDVLGRSWNLVQNYLRVFLNLDEDGSGHLDPFELWPGLMEAGYKINTTSFKYLLHTFGDEDKNVHFAKFIACLLLMAKLQNFLKNEDNAEGFSFQNWIDSECEAFDA